MFLIFGVLAIFIILFANDIITYFDISAERCISCDFHVVFTLPCGGANYPGSKDRVSVRIPVYCWWSLVILPTCTF